MSFRVNYIGKKFGRLTVIEYYGKAKDKCSLWLCSCECGGTKVARSSNLKKGFTLSCGCLQKEYRENFNNHKKGKITIETRLHRIWKAIKSRCYNENTKNFKWYGERGIKVCDEWKNNYKSFEKWALENGYQDDLTIDRIDVNGNYEPSNCRWITLKEQQQNKRNIIFSIKVKSLLEKYNLTKDELWNFFDKFIEKEFKEK